MLITNKSQQEKSQEKEEEEEEEEEQQQQQQQQLLNSWPAMLAVKNGLRYQNMWPKTWAFLKGVVKWTVAPAHTSSYMYIRALLVHVPIKQKRFSVKQFPLNSTQLYKA